MVRVFISYRRADSITMTGRIHDHLVTAFGSENIFKDVDDIPLGVDFRSVIEREVTACNILLVIIGLRWLDSTDDSHSRRLDNPNDFVRIEIEMALRNPQVTIIPVLVHGATMPPENDLPDSLRPLAFLNAAVVRDDPDFNRDVNRLVQHIRQNDRSLPTGHPADTTQAPTEKAPAPKSAPKGQIITSPRRLSTGKIVRSVFYLLLIYLVTAALLALAEDKLYGRYSSKNLKVGDIAQWDIYALFDTGYQSQVMTEQRRQAAVAAAPTVYNPPDPNVARQQIQKANQTFDFIEGIRKDAYATLEQRVADFNQIAPLTLDDALIMNILSMGDETWTDVRVEAVGVLEKTMRSDIRESNLDIVKNRLPTQVSVRFDDKTTQAIVALVEDFIQPNTFINESATSAARQSAMEAVEPVARFFASGQIVVRAGQQIGEADLEALEKTGYGRPPASAADAVLEIAGRGLVAMGVLLIALWLLSPRIRDFLKFLFSWRVNIKRLS